MDKIQERLSKLIGKKGMIVTKKKCYRIDNEYENVKELEGYNFVFINNIKYIDEEKSYFAKITMIHGHGIGWVRAEDIDILDKVLKEN